MVMLTTEKILSRKIDFKDLHHKIKKILSKILRKKNPYENGLKTLCYHFPITIIFWFQ